MADARFVIDVGGIQYVSTRSTLDKSPTLRKALGKHDAASESPPFIDRDGFAFQHVLNFLRNGTVQNMEDRHYIEFLILEAGFYGLPKMESQLSKMLSAPREELSRISDITAELRALKQLLKRLSDPA